MRRVLVIGCAGRRQVDAVARSSPTQLGLPFIYLDRHLLAAGLGEPRDSELGARDRRSDWPQTPAWVMDGNFSGHVRPAHAARRHARSGSTIRAATCMPPRPDAHRQGLRHACGPDLPDGCPEKFDLEFLRFVWDFPRRAAGRSIVDGYRSAAARTCGVVQLHRRPRRGGVSRATRRPPDAAVPHQAARASCRGRNVRPRRRHRALSGIRAAVPVACASASGPTPGRVWKRSSPT